tara:strand:- start:887 stop:1105 length:219 start_codon:yes stop_codon:yes gene_type:complete
VKNNDRETWLGFPGPRGAQGEQMKDLFDDVDAKKYYYDMDPDPPLGETGGAMSRLFILVLLAMIVAAAWQLP